jgi:hypothetical protein
MYKHLVCREGHSIEWSFDKIPVHVSTEIGLVYPTKTLHSVARIVCTLWLMADEPEVLKDDEEKFERSGNLSLVEKARRRSNYGWHVGGRSSSHRMSGLPVLRPRTPVSLP